MKKTLVALASLAIAGGASAQVTITGFFNGSYDNFSITNTTRTSNTSENRVTDNSSRIIFGVNEKLTNDLNAIGQFDLRFSVDQTARVNAVCATPAVATQDAIANTSAGGVVAAQTSATAGGCAVPNPVSSGNSHLGLSSKTMGTIRLGRQDIHYTEGGNFNPVGLGTIHSAAGLANTAAAGATVGRASRSANLIWWTSPKFNNMDVTAGYSTNSTAASGQQDTENDLASNQRKGGTTYLRVSYADGPLSLVYSTINEKSDWIGTAATAPALSLGSTAAAQTAVGAQAAQTQQADRNGNVFTAKYDFGKFKLGGAYWQNESTAYTAGASGDTSKRGAWQMGLGFPMGASNLAVTYTKLGTVKANGVEAANTGATHTTLAYSYDFSKTTQGVLAYTSLANSSSGAHSLFYNGDNVLGSIGSSAVAGERHSVSSVGLRVGF